jgi:hypothetical protein
MCLLSIIKIGAVPIYSYFKCLALQCGRALERINIEHHEKKLDYLERPV